MLDDEIVDKLVDRLVNRIENANEYVLRQIGNTIKQISTMNITKRQQLAQILKFGSNYDNIVNKLAEITKLNVIDIYKIFEEIAKIDYRFSKRFYEYRELNYIPYEQNKAFQRQVKALAKITADEYINISHTTAFAVIRNNKRKYIKLAEMYQQIIDEGIISIAQGKETFYNNMRRTIKEIGNSGIRTVNYASGYSRRLDSAVRMNIKEGLSQLHNQIQEDFGEEFGADGVEISTHLYPSKDHEKIQGHQYTNEQYKKLNENLKRPIGTLNCYHYVFSIIMEVSKPNKTKKQLQEIIDNNKKGFMYEDKHYTMYEGTQLQRRIETEIRKAKETKLLAKSSGDEELTRDMQKRISDLTIKYKELNNISGLPSKLGRARIIK